MGWFNDLWDWTATKIAAYIHDASWITFIKISLAGLIVLSAIGFVAFWWWLLNKALNHGGDH